MKHTRIFLIAVSFFICGCTVPKDARILKRSTKEWRQSPEVLWAYSDSPMVGTTLTLRENKTFEHSSGFFGFLFFQAGSWAHHQDTISLSYMNSKKEITEERAVVIDRTTSTLIFENDSTPVLFRLRILQNNL